MPNFVVPTAESVKKMLEMMYGSDLRVVKREDTSTDGCYAATFIDDEEGLVALCGCDDNFVGYSGAALTMLPAGIAEEMIADGKFNETVLENFYEVMNVCSSLLMSDTSPHLRLHKTLAPADAGGAFSALNGESTTVGFDVDIPRYGSGGLIFRVG